MKIQECKQRVEETIYCHHWTGDNLEETKAFWQKIQSIFPKYKNCTLTPYKGNKDNLIIENEEGVYCFCHKREWMLIDSNDLTFLPDGYFQLNYTLIEEEGK